jgi:hypothetical protein
MLYRLAGLRPSKVSGHARSWDFLCFGLVTQEAHSLPTACILVTTVDKLEYSKYIEYKLQNNIKTIENSVPVCLHQVITRKPRSQFPSTQSERVG